MQAKDIGRQVFPDHKAFMGRQAKEARLRQHSKVIWFTGFSGSGKSTLTRDLEQSLFSDGYFVQVLDGDNIRTGINNNLGFSEEERMENIRRIAEVSKLFMEAGVICLNSFISPTEHIRKVYREILGAENVLEVHVSTPIGICEQRDSKGLYAKARAGLIPDFTGITAPFEAPVNPLISIDTSLESPAQCLLRLREVILPHIQY